MTIKKIKEQLRGLGLSPSDVIVYSEGAYATIYTVPHRTMPNYVKFSLDYTNAKQGVVILAYFEGFLQTPNTAIVAKKLIVDIMEIFETQELYYFDARNTHLSNLKTVFNLETLDTFLNKRTSSPIQFYKLTLREDI